MGQKLRQLHCKTFDELHADVMQLRQRGYEQGGAWDLPKIEYHLAKSIVAPIDGQGPKLYPPATWVARFIIRRMAKLDQYPNFVFPVPKFMRPLPDLQCAQTDTMFDSAIERAKQVTGPTVKTRAFGTLATSDWKGMQLLHASHHLAFLKPKL